ncbi:MAG: alpha/beta hydrolase [Actinomycetota bacterium]|nr:alpha/beta hydrolase [Actinomycetota bacterium]
MSTPPYLELPAGVTAGTLCTGRGDFAARVAPASRPRGTVVLLPGWTGSKEDFIALLPLLRDAGWSTVSYDQRGQYESPAGHDEDFTLDGFAADACAVAAAVDDRPVHLLGHSFGGLVAQTAVLAQPASFASLTLLCSGPAAFTDTARAALLSRLADALATETLADVYAAKLEHDACGGGGATPSPEVAAFLRRRFLANHPGSLAAISRLLVSAQDRVAELAQLDVPIHVVYGADDDGWPTAVQDAMAARLGGVAHVLPAAGHSPAAENPRATAELLSRLLTDPPTTATPRTPRGPALRPG